MKKIWLYTLVLTLFVPATAQNIALGERVPELKIATWLAGAAPPDAPLTYIEFFHTSNKSGTASLKKLSDLSIKYSKQLRIVVVTREGEDKITPLVASYTTRFFGVGLDPAGKLFTAYGVSYVPFGVLTDAKNRALWMGNTMQLTPEIIEQNIR